MKLEAKSRLISTRITSGVGDAQPLRDALVEGVHLFPRMKSLTAAGSLRDAIRVSEGFSDSLERGFKSTFSKLGLRNFETHSDRDSNSAISAFASVEFGNAGDLACFEYFMLSNRAGITFSINSKVVAGYDWRPDLFEPRLYRNFVVEAIGYFEKHGFGGPKT